MGLSNVHVYLTNVTCITKFNVNNRTDTKKTDINLFFTITNCHLDLFF